jgi:hypothetical protein
MKTRSQIGYDDDNMGHAQRWVALLIGVIKDQKAAQIDIGEAQPDASRAHNLWRGDLSPLGCAAAPRASDLIADTPRHQILGLLRSPTGINPLTTKVQRMV